jgi:hypothetical protein
MDFIGYGDFTIHTVATDHTIVILHVPDSLATTALGDFLIHTVSLLLTHSLINLSRTMDNVPRFPVALSPCLPTA